MWSTPHPPHTHPLATPLEAYNLTDGYYRVKRKLVCSKEIPFYKKKPPSSKRDLLVIKKTSFLKRKLLLNVDELQVDMSSIVSEHHTGCFFEVKP